METTNGKKEHPLTEMLGNSIGNLQKLVNADTIVGTPITTPDGTVIIPVSKVSFAFAAGGGDLPTAKPSQPFGGGSGGGMTITPLAFLVVSAGHVELLNISAPSNSVDRVVDMVPGLIDKVGVAFQGFGKTGAKAATSAAEHPLP